MKVQLSLEELAEQAKKIGSIDETLESWRALYRSASNSGVYWSHVVKHTQDHEKELKDIVARYKVLEGSEKQISWALQIREEQATSCAYEIVTAKYFAADEDDENWLVHQMKKIEKVYSFLSSEKASIIIDNRKAGI